MTLPFNQFIQDFPTNSVVNNKDGQYIYEKIIWDPQTRINFVNAINRGVPPLTACVNEIENYCLTTPLCKLDLQNNTVKQTIGRMVKVALTPLGYTPHKSKSINSRFFSSATTYVLKENL